MRVPSRGRTRRWTLMAAPKCLMCDKRVVASKAPHAVPSEERHRDDLCAIHAHRFRITQRILREAPAAIESARAFADAVAIARCEPSTPCRNAPTSGWCFGSKKAPVDGTIAVEKFRGWTSRDGICSECGQKRGLQSNSLIALHTAPAGYRRLDYTDPALAFACPTCKVATGERCLTIDKVADYEGRDRGRVQTMFHRVRKSLVKKT